MAAPSSNPRRQAGATALEPAGRSRKGLWALLALVALLALAVVVFLVVRNAGDDGDDSGVDVTDDPQSGGSGTDAEEGGAGEGQTTTSVVGDAGGQPPTSGPPAGGLATSTGEAILPPPGSGLADLAGDDVQGTAMVDSVVSDEGFWVGDGPERRVFVFLTPEARNSTGESPFQVTAGQTIELTGTVVESPSHPSALGVDDGEGGAELASLGGYVEATEIALSQ